MSVGKPLELAGSLTSCNSKVEPAFPWRTLEFGFAGCNAGRQAATLSLWNTNLEQDVTSLPLAALWWGYKTLHRDPWCKGLPTNYCPLSLQVRCFFLKPPNDTWESQHLKDLYSLQGTTGPWAQRTGPAFAAAAPSWDPQPWRGSRQGGEAKPDLEGSASAGLLPWQSCHRGGLLLTNTSPFLRPLPFSGDVNHSAQELSCCVTSENRLWQHRWQQQLQCSLPARFCSTSGAVTHSLSTLGRPECPCRSIPYHPESVVLLSGFDAG